MWPCSWGLALCVSPLPDLSYHTEKPFTVCLVEQMLHRAEHAWLVWRCKITLSHQMLQAQLLSPLKSSMENQQPNSRIPCWSVKLSLLRASVYQCVYFALCEGDGEGIREIIQRRTEEKLPFSCFPINHSFSVTSQVRETEQVKQLERYEVEETAHGCFRVRNT